MALPKVEAFTNSNGTALTTHNASWVEARTASISAAAIQGNQLAPNTGFAYASMYVWTGDVFANDQYAQAVYAAGGDYQGPCVRFASTASHGYIVDATNGDRYLEVMAGFSAPASGFYTDAGALSPGDVQRLEVVGTTLTYKVNGSTVGTATDATWSSGSAGLHISGTSASAARLDSWEGGNVGAAPQNVSPAFLGAGSTVFAPALTKGNVNVAPALIASTATVFAPSITKGNVNVSPSFLAAASTVFAPALSPGGVSVGPALIVATSVVYVPSASVGNTLAPALLVSTSVLFAPTFTPGGTTVAAGFLASHAVLFLPTLAGVVPIVWPLPPNPVVTYLPGPGAGSAAPTYQTSIAIYGIAIYGISQYGEPVPAPGAASVSSAPMTGVAVGV